MKTIYKYEIQPDASALGATLMLPERAKFLHIEEQTNDNVYAWFLVETDNHLEEKRLLIAPTGYALDKFNLGPFLGTFLCLNKSLVFHVFELKN